MVVVLTGPCSGSPWVAAFSSLLWCGVLHRLQMDFCSTACGATPSLTLVFSMGCRGISALKPGVSHPSFTPLILVCTGPFLSHFFHSLTAGFLKILSQMHWKYCLSSTCPGEDPLDLTLTRWNQLCWDGAAPLLFSQMPPVNYCHCQHLDT